MTQSACGTCTTSLPTRAVGMTLESRAAKKEPSAPGPITAIAERSARPGERRCGRSLGAIEALEHLVLHPEALALAWETAFAYLGGIAGDRLLDGRAGLGVALHERRRKAGEHSDHVVEHQHLPVAVRAGTDADRRDTDALGD